MRSGIAPEIVFPDYELPDHTGTRRRLSELQGDDPLSPTFEHGHDCPKEHQQHWLEQASGRENGRGREEEGRMKVKLVPRRVRSS